jgi:hypothetical protein
MQQALTGTATRDLVTIDGLVLVFGGPYGNLEAMIALFDAAERLAIPGSHAICSGDIAAYGADPQAVVGGIRAWRRPVVMGNCDAALSADAADRGCGLFLVFCRLVAARAAGSSGDRTAYGMTRRRDRTAVTLVSVIFGSILVAASNRTAPPDTAAAHEDGTKRVSTASQERSARDGVQ